MSSAPNTTTRLDDCLSVDVLALLKRAAEIEARMLIDVVLWASDDSPLSELVVEDVGAAGSMTAERRTSRPRNGGKMKKRVSIEIICDVYSRALQCMVCVWGTSD